MAAQIRNPFNPIRFTGRNGLLTVEEASRLQDLIKNQGAALVENIKLVFEQQINDAITNIVLSFTSAAGPPGPRGEDGADGDPGPPGQAGAAGTRGVDGAPGPAGAPGLPGDNGDDGEPGPMGPPGPAGATGSTGSPGAQGVPGSPGNDGADGEPGEVGLPGPAGPQGATGPAGLNGRDGEDGEPGQAGASGTTITGLGFVHANGIGGIGTRQGNGFNTSVDLISSAFGTTLVSGDSLVVVGPYDLTSIEALGLSIADNAAMAII